MKGTIVLLTNLMFALAIAKIVIRRIEDHVRSTVGGNIVGVHLLGVQNKLDHAKFWVCSVFQFTQPNEISTKFSHPMVAFVIFKWCMTICQVQNSTSICQWNRSARECVSISKYVQKSFFLKAQSIRKH